MPERNGPGRFGGEEGEEGAGANGTFGAAGWLVVDKLKAVIGMLSLAAGAMAEEVVEIDEESILVELILMVVAVLAVVVWEITKKACGTKVKKIKGPVEEPSQEKKGPRKEAHGLLDHGRTGQTMGFGPGRVHLCLSSLSGAKSQEQDLVVVCHGVLSQDGAAFGGHSRRQETGVMASELVGSRKNEKLGMGKERKVTYGMIKWRRKCVGEVNAGIGRRQLGQSL